MSKEAGFTTSKYARDQWTVVRNKLVGDSGTAAKDKDTAGADGVAGDAGSKKAAGKKRGKPIPHEL